MHDSLGGMHCNIWWVEFLDTIPLGCPAGGKDGLAKLREYHASRKLPTSTGLPAAGTRKGVSTQKVHPANPSIILCKNKKVIAQASFGMVSAKHGVDVQVLLMWTVLVVSSYTKVTHVTHVA